jgi:hypothetical protein
MLLSFILSSSAAVCRGDQIILIYSRFSMGRAQRLVDTSGLASDIPEKFIQ